MFASRFFKPALRTATRTFTSTARAQAPLAIPRVRGTPFTNSFRKYGKEETWRRAYGRAQQREYQRQAFNYQRFQASRSLLRKWAARPTFYYELGGIGVVIGVIYVSNLQEVPVSGRRRFNILSPSWEKWMSESMYQQVLQEYSTRVLPPSSKEQRMVQRVLDRLIPHSGLGSEDWEVHVINDPQKNAFVIPGNKVFVFSGILDVCQDDDGLAAVLGHEIAHNVAHHAAERMSQFSILLVGGIIVWFSLGTDPGMLQMVANLAFSLPGSRSQEREADYIGLLMMAESCYDPEAAVGLWARMEKEEEGAPPQFMSTHPSSHDRQEKIRDWMPEAETKRENSGCYLTSRFANDFKKTVDFQRW